MKIAAKILDPRLVEWGFPSRGSELAAGIDLHACIDAPLHLTRQAPAVLISAGFAMRIGDPEWCGMILPRSGLGHKRGLVLGNTIGLIDADYEGPILISAWDRNPAGYSEEIVIRPGERIAQLAFVKIARPAFEMVAEFPVKSTRGDRGFGSSGTAAGTAAGCGDPER